VNSSVCVVGTDATMVYDAVHNVIAEALGELDPSFALQDFTAKDVTSSGGEPITPRVIEALNTPPFLVERRVVVVRDAQSLVADEVTEVLAWMSDPAPDVVLVLAVVGTKANKLVKGATSVVEVNVGSRTADRVTFVEAKLGEYRVNVDHEAAVKITDRLGDDVARVDGLARTLQTIYGTAQLNFTHVEPYLGDAGDVPEWDLTDAIDGGMPPRPSSSHDACWIPRAALACRSSISCSVTICGWPSSKGAVFAPPMRPERCSASRVSRRPRRYRCPSDWELIESQRPCTGSPTPTWH